MLKVHLDPNNHNGAVFLGLNGVVVKSHGSADAKGVANAVHVAAKLLRENITQRITEDLDHFRANFPSESQDRKSVMEGKSESGRLYLCSRRRRRKRQQENKYR